MIDVIKLKYLKAKLKYFEIIGVPTADEVMIILENTIKMRQARNYIRAIKDDIEKQKDEG